MVYLGKYLPAIFTENQNTVERNELRLLKVLNFINLQHSFVDPHNLDMNNREQLQLPQSELPEKSILNLKIYCSPQVWIKKVEEVFQKMHGSSLAKEENIFNELTQRTMRQLNNNNIPLKLFFTFIEI